MKKKTIVITTAIMLIGLVAYHGISLGSTFVSSLIHGKSVGEAVQILAEQVDLLIGRVSILETKNSENEKQEACNYAETILTTAQIQGGIISPETNTFDGLISEITKARDGKLGNGEVGTAKNPFPDQKDVLMWQERLDKVHVLKDKYLIAEDKCKS